MVIALAAAGCFVSLVSANAFSNLQVVSPSNTINSSSSTIAQLNFTNATGTDLTLTSLSPTQIPYVTTSKLIIGDNNLTYNGIDDSGFGGILNCNCSVSSGEFLAGGPFGSTALSGGTLSMSVPTYNGSNYYLFFSNPAGKQFAWRDDGRFDIGANVNTTTHAQIIFKDYDSTSGSPKILLNNSVTNWSAIGNNQVGDIIFGTNPDVNDWADRWITIQRSNGDVYPERSNIQNLGQASSSWLNIYASGTVFGVNVSSTNVSSTAAFHGIATITNVTSTGLFSTLLGFTNATGGNASTTGLYVQSNLLVGNMATINSVNGLRIAGSGHNGQADFSPGFLQIGTTSADKIDFFTSNAFRVSLDTTGNWTPYVNNAGSLGAANLSWVNVYASGTVFGVNVSSTNATTTNLAVLNNLEVGSGSGASNIVTSNKVCTFLNMNVGTNSSTLINSLINASSHILVSSYGATSTIQVNSTTTGAVSFRPVVSGSVVNNGATNDFSACVLNGF